MQQVLDSDSPILALKWRHRNPVFMGWIVGMGLLIVMAFFMLILGVINRNSAELGNALSMFFPLVMALLYLLFLLMPGIIAMHLFKQVNEVAAYKNQFNLSFKASYAPNALSITIFGLSNGSLKFSNGAETLGGFIAIFVMAAILSLITSSILALFFRKRAINVA